MRQRRRNAVKTTMRIVPEQLQWLHEHLFYETSLVHIASAEASTHTLRLRGNLLIETFVPRR